MDHSSSVIMTGLYRARATKKGSNRIRKKCSVLFEAEGYRPPTIAKILKSEGIFVSRQGVAKFYQENIRNLLVCCCWASSSKTREGTTCTTYARAYTCPYQKTEEKKI